MGPHGVPRIRGAVGGALVEPAERLAGLPEDRLEAAETRALVAATIASLPPLQAEVIRLRDVAGWSADEVRNALDLTETNQRVLLHRARAKVRRALDEYLEAER